MSKYCVYIPNGEAKKKLFNKLNKTFGYNNAAYIFNRVTHKDFIEKYHDSLTLDDGIPTFESVMSNDAVINTIGEENIIKFLNKGAEKYDNTLNNVSMLIERANEYNQNKDNKKYVAYVDTNDDKLVLTIAPRTDNSINIAENQHKIHELNKIISDLLEPLGITMGELSSNVVKVGKVGETDFNKAADTANGLATMMAVANNIEGYYAISEEFSHFIVGVYRYRPLVARSIAALKNENMLKEVLGDQYEDTVNYHNGNIDFVAEEALGKIFRDTLLNRQSTSNLNAASNKSIISRFKDLFNRAINYVVSLFKGYNPAYVKEAIDYVKSNMSDMADSILNQKEKISKRDVASAERNAKFNALSEKMKVQMDVIKNIEERFYKNIELQQNLQDDDYGKYKKAASKLASKVHNKTTAFVNEGETIAAIDALLNLSTKNLTDMYNALDKIEDASSNDRFLLLRNVLYTLQSYAPTIKDLKDITESAFIEDEEVQKQKFVVGDVTDRLIEFEADGPVEQVDTSKMTSEQIVKQIQDDAKNLELSKSGEYYVDKKNKERFVRVTKMVSASTDDEKFDNSNVWNIPSTNIGDGNDEFWRDVVDGRIVKDDKGKYTVDGKKLSDVYPNATEKYLQKLADDIDKFKKQCNDAKIKLVSRDITVNGTVTVTDAQGKPHEINVAGTVDLLGYNEESGKFYIYDMKTYRSSIDAEKLGKYSQQLTLYKEFLEQKYGIEIEQIAILPTKVSYPAPKGFRNSKNEYTTVDKKPQGYNGVKGNQLKLNGKLFKKSNPQFQGMKVLETKKTNVKYSKLGIDGSENVKAVLEALTTADRLYTQLANLFNEKANKYTVKFFSDAVGRNVKIREVDEKTGELTGKLETRSIEEILSKAPKDTNLLQRFLLPMSDNPDAYMQIYDYIYQDKMHDKRFKMIPKAREIMALGIEYEKKGIRDYKWMFEEDKKNYVSHLVVGNVDYSYDRSAYEKAKKEYIDELNKKYGEFPEVGSDEFIKKKDCLIKWIDEHTEDIDIPIREGSDIKITKTIPDHNMFPSKYSSFSATQKEFYDKWIAIKKELDDCLEKDATTTTNTIKIRKSGYERLQDLGERNLSHFLDGVKYRFIESFDDENNYSKGIKGFDDKKVMRLPILYVNAKETEDITTDVIGSLIAYADMCYNYEAMNEIVNPLEIAKFLAKDRKINKTSKGKWMYDEFSMDDINAKNPIYIGENSNFMAQLEDFMESKIYNKHLKDAGTFKMFGKDADVQKVAGEALKLGSIVQLGFNGLAGLANVVTGTAMQRIEGIAGEFYSTFELAKADAVFGKESISFMSDIGQRRKESKLSLFDELFDVRQNFSKNIRHINFKNKNLLLRIFGPNIQYICQDAGDHWMYNRSAIAIALRYKLIDSNGNKISLWDALQVVDVDPNNPDAGKTLILKDGVTKEDGTEFTDDDIKRISNRIKYINHRCFGVYDPEDSVAARRTVLGRFLMQYRDWIPAQMEFRFGQHTTNFNKGVNEDGTAYDVEGYYRTFFRFASDIVKELKNGELNIIQTFDELEDYEKANIKRAIAEIFQLISVYIIAGVLKGGKKKKDRKYSWARNTLGYIFTREKTELGALVPVVQMGALIDIVKSPAAATSVISDLYNLRLLIDPRNYFDEIQSGDYKGHSSAYRAFCRSPLTLYYRTLKRQLKPEKAETFYSR